MHTYQRYLIKETDLFDASVFPELGKSIQQTRLQLEAEPTGPSIEMILSFAKDHCINSQHVKDHPRLAYLISTKELPLQVMEQLFESSKQNVTFRSGLEDYITVFLNTERSSEQ